MIDLKEKELLEAGKPLEEALLTAAEEYAIECAMLKVYGSEVLDFVADEGVQVYGGMGYSEETPVARAYRDSRINRIFEGTNEINRMLTVDMLLKRAMKGKIDLMSPALAVQKELMSVPTLGGESATGPLAAEHKALKNMKKAALMVSGAAVQKFMQSLAKEQEILMNLADMLMTIYACESMLLKTEKLISMTGEVENQSRIDMTRVYFSDCIELINIYGKHAITSFAEGDEMRVMLLGLKRFTKHDPVNTKDLRRNIAKELIEANGYCY